MRRSGSNALLYSGLLLSSSVVIERAFMRNMFSVDDPVLRQVEIAASNYATLVTDTQTTKLNLVAKATAFRVLYESLLWNNLQLKLGGIALPILKQHGTRPGQRILEMFAELIKSRMESCEHVTNMVKCYHRDRDLRMQRVV